MYSRTARVSTVRWNLKEAVSESLVRRTEIAYKARLRVISWQRTVKSNNYHVCRSRVNAADIWRERACTLVIDEYGKRIVACPTEDEAEEYIREQEE